ncbi:Ig-like domain-containing protein, partial [Vibrio profundi]|uniref:Ig-like domain-containing protein n=1 Tax=Vibrio profundi TaxID=1774960 RepID=UPI003735F000
MELSTLIAGGALAVGQRIVIDTNGNIRIVEQGEQLQLGDVVLESFDASSNTPQKVSLVNESGETEITDEIADIFAALEEGQDPTQLSDEFATAAGGSDGSSLVSSGSVERDGTEAIADTEFDTEGLESLGLSETQSLSLLEAFNNPIDALSVTDVTPPQALTIALEIDSGSASDDFLTNDGRFSVTNIEEGATVEYLVDGVWTTTEPTPTEGTNTITVRQTDSSGNSSEISELNFTLDTTAPNTPSISLVSDTGSSNQDLLTNDGNYSVSGTEDGAVIEYLVDGIWTEAAPEAIEGENTITVRQTDAAGNTSGSGTLTFTLDTTPPSAPNLSLGNDTGDSALDLTTNDGTLIVSGIEDGAIVEYLVDGTWTDTQPTPEEGVNTVVVRQTDAAGNTSESTTLEFTLDTQAEPGVVTVDDITSDDLITETEKGQTILVTGSAVGGDIQPGDTVSAIINETAYTAVVESDGSWELSVSGEDLSNDTDFDVTVNSTDLAGNAVTSSGNSTHTFDTTEVNVNIDIDPITEDSVINAIEAERTVTITGTVTGESFTTGTVVLTVNGIEYQGQVVDGQYSIDVNGSDLTADSDNIVDAKLNVVNEAGNIGSATSTEFYLVDTSARGTISIDSIAEDDVINKEESESTVTVTGSVGGDAATGDQVTVVVNGETYTTVVQADKTWSVNVEGSDLAAGSSVSATVTGEDWVGNEFSGSTSQEYGIDTAITIPSIELVASSDSGKEDAHGSDTDNLTNDKTPTFSLGNIDADVVAAGIVVL